MSAPIFISYSSKDQDIAETICRALEARGQRCWIAARDVHAGENFQEAIVRALRGAKVMLLVFTANANNSDEIKKELVLAGRHQVTVVPVRVEDVVPNDAFSYEFATRQWVDLFKDWEREIELLATRIGHLLQAGSDGNAVAPALPPRPQAPPSSRLPLYGGAALVAVLLIGGAVLYLRPAAKPAPNAAVTSAAPPPVASLALAPTPPPTLPAPLAVVPAPQQQTAMPATRPPQAEAPPSPPQTALASPAADPDDAAWASAAGAATIAAFRDYQKAFPSGVHAQDAEVHILDLILANAAPSKNFDGTWATTWTCPQIGSALGYSYQFTGRVADGVYHALKGAMGERGSLAMDGKIEPDGTAALYGKGIVGASAFAVGGVQAGTPFYFHAAAQFDHKSGAGHRIEGRSCSITFAKQ